MASSSTCCTNNNNSAATAPNGHHDSSQPVAIVVPARGEPASGEPAWGGHHLRVYLAQARLSVGRRPKSVQQEAQFRSLAMVRGLNRRGAADPGNRTRALSPWDSLRSSPVICLLVSCTCCLRSVRALPSKSLKPCATLFYLVL